MGMSSIPVWILFRKEAVLMLLDTMLTTFCQYGNNRNKEVVSTGQGGAL